MRVDVVLRHDDLTQRSCAGKTAIVIDVLRATTSITTALMNGAKAITPVIEPDEAFALREKKGCLIAGERGGLMIEGFDFGNSPMEFVHDKVAGKTIVFCTSNGTKAMKKTLGAKDAILACFLNVEIVADFAKSTGRDVMIVCAGTLGNPSLEDSVCGGMIAEMLSGIPSGKTEEAISVFRQYRNRLDDCMRDSHHGQHLIKIGFEADLDFASQKGITKIIPAIQIDEDGMMIINTAK